MAQSASRTGDLQLLAASVVTGIAGAGFILAVERHLGLVGFAPIAQLWSIWSITAASLMFAFQQWSIRVGIGHSSGCRSALHGRPLALLLLSTVGAGIAATLARVTLFQSSSMFWPTATALVVLGAILSGITRGVLARANRSTALAMGIGAENLIRVIFALILISMGAESWWFGVALLAGFSVVALLFLPGNVRGPNNLHDERGSATLGSAAVAGFLSHAALAGPPILAASNGGSPKTVSTMFVVLSAVRIPHLLLQGGAPRAGVIFQQWFDAGEADKLRLVRTRIAGIGLVTALLAGLLGIVLGDPLIGSIFAISGEVDPLSYGLVSSAAVLSVAATLATVQLVAEQRNRLVVECWAFPLAAALVAALIARVTELNHIALGLFALHLVVLASLTIAPTRYHTDSADHSG